MEVVFKEGMLYVKGNKFGKKTWRKTWIVLYPTSIFGIGRVEFHDILDGGHTTTKSKSTQCRRIVQLCDCLSVTLVPEESFAPALPNDDCRAFDLNTTQRRYILASENYHDWVGALCQLAFQKEPGHTETREKERGGGMGIPMEENELYATWKTAQYQVTVKTNEASRRCQLTGSYLLLPERDAILLQDLQTGVTVNCWPYHLLRRFGQVKVNGGFSIEAGRRCSSGEGQFTFMSKHAPQIYKAMEDALTLHREMENEDTKTSIQPPSNSSSPQLPHSSTSTHLPNNSSSPQLPHSSTSTHLPNNSSSPQLPHSSTSTHPPRNSSSPQLPHSSTSTHPPIKHRVHTRTDLSDRPTAPPLPMRNNLLHSPPIISPVTEQVPGSEPMADSDCDLYATIEDHLLPRMKHPPAPLRMQHSLHLYEEEEEEERCHSLDTVDLNKLRLGVGLGEGSPYYNLRRGITGRAEEEEEEERERESMVGSSQCIYALVNKPSETQPLSLAWSLPQPQTQSRSMPNLSRLQAQAQLQGEEEMGLRGSITPNQDPISFKQKLSDILGKDLAKFQQPLPPLATVTPRGSEY